MRAGEGGRVVGRHWGVGGLGRRRRWVLTAHFHAAERRGLRHWFAALGEGCRPGPPRHDDPDDPDRCHSRLGWWRWGLGERDSVACYTAGLVGSSPPNLLIQKRMTSEWVAGYLQGARQPGKAVTFISLLLDSSPRVSFHPNQLAEITSTGGRSQHYFIPYSSQLLFFLPPSPPLFLSPFSGPLQTRLKLK